MQCYEGKIYQKHSDAAQRGGYWANAIHAYAFWSKTYICPSNRKKYRPVFKGVSIGCLLNEKNQLRTHVALLLVAW